MQNSRKKALIETILTGRRKRLATHIYTIHWQIQQWTTRKWAEDGWSEITPEHLRLIHILAGGEGISNNELAKQTGVTKQAMSQMVTLLEKRGVVHVLQNPEDSRGKLISLSDYGFEFLAYLGTSTDELMKEFGTFLGAEKMKMLTDLSTELADWLMQKGMSTVPASKSVKKR